MTLYASRTGGLAFIPVRDGYIVDGGGQREHVTGNLARELFPALLPLLDGTRTEDGIAEALGLPLAYVRQVLALLARRDLVHLRPAPACTHPSPMEIFLQRSHPAAQADAIRRRLRVSNVAVSCGQPLTALVTGLLRQSGVSVLDGSTTSPCLTITTMPDRAPLPPDVPVLPVRVTPGAVSIGPLVRPDDPAGYDAAPGECDPTLAGVAAGVIAGIAQRVLGGQAEHRDRELINEVLNTGGLMRLEKRPPGQDGEHPPPGPGTRPAASCRHPARHHLTERRLPLRRRGTQPLLRRISRILDGLHHAPAAGHADAMHAYLLGDLHDGRRTYFVDPATGDLVELPCPVTPARDTPTLVLTHDPCTESGLLPGDTGLILAHLAANAAAVGWRVRAVDSPVHLDLDAASSSIAAPAAATTDDGERTAAVVELTPMWPKARPARRVRPPTGGHPGDGPLDRPWLTRVIDCALARVEEIWGNGRLGCTLYTRAVSGTSRWTREPDQPCDLNLDILEHHLLDRGLSPAALLLFTADYAATADAIPDDRDRMQAAMAAATVRLPAADAGMAAVLLARLPGLARRLPGSDRRVLYGCALGSPPRDG